MTPDHWGFVLAAYGLAAVTLGGYWRRLLRLERELSARGRAASSSGPRSRATAGSGDPRADAGKGHP